MRTDTLILSKDQHSLIADKLKELTNNNLPSLIEKLKNDGFRNTPFYISYYSEDKTWSFTSSDSTLVKNIKNLVSLEDFLKL